MIFIILFIRSGINLIWAYSLFLYCFRDVAQRSKNRYNEEVTGFSDPVIRDPGQAGIR